MEILIFCEAGEQIGLGHFTRCSAIADRIAEHGMTVKHFVYFKNQVIDDDKVIEMNWLEEDPSSLINHQQIVLVDSYLAPRHWISKVHKLSNKLICIDDYNRLCYPADLVINPNVFSRDIDYSNQRAQVVGGADYVVLRKPFRKAHKEGFPNHKPIVLITIGGSDFRNLLPRLTSWCMDTNLYQVRAVIPHALEGVSQNIEVLPLLEADDMVAEMLNADVVISAGGQTLHELAALAKPVIGIGLANDQLLNYQYYHDNGFLKQYIWWDHLDIEDKVRNELIRLSNKSERLLQADSVLSFNTQGVDNIIRAMLS